MLSLTICACQHPTHPCADVTFSRKHLLISWVRSQCSCFYYCISLCTPSQQPISPTALLFKCHANAVTWMNLKCILLSERSQTQKAVYWMLPFIWHSGNDKNHREQKQMSGCEGLKSGRRVWLERHSTGSLGNDELFYILIVVIVTHATCSSKPIQLYTKKCRFINHKSRGKNSDLLKNNLERLTLSSCYPFPFLFKCILICQGKIWGCKEDRYMSFLPKYYHRGGIQPCTELNSIVWTMPYIRLVFRRYSGDIKRRQWSDCSRCWEFKMSS